MSGGVGSRTAMADVESLGPSESPPIAVLSRNLGERLWSERLARICFSDTPTTHPPSYLSALLSSYETDDDPIYSTPARATRAAASEQRSGGVLTILESPWARKTNFWSWSSELVKVQTSKFMPFMSHACV